MYTTWHIVDAVYSGIIFLGAILTIYVSLFFKAVGLPRVQLEAHIGNTGNSVRLSLVLISSAKCKPIM